MTTFLTTRVTGIGIDFILTQSVTANLLTGTNTYIVTIPSFYDADKQLSYVRINTTGGIIISIDPNFWTKEDSTTYALTVKSVNDMQFDAGSLDVTFTDVSNNPIEKFVAIPGRLDTPILNNGGYANTVVECIFNKLKNYLYPQSIFGNILNKLTAFFNSVGLSQDVTEGIFLLNNELIEGKININQFNELVTKSVEDIASEYGSNYEKNYTAVNAAIENYKYLLEN